ncbi:MAG: TetR/AcrR family transcriptional regulator [Alphaproteobacteria bacterium]|nr:TetR/AcrR family transcriptional regulator [Alphaproteobacteria bacterium]
MTTKRDRQREATRAHILEVALQCFSERGFNGTSIAEIARRAGVSKGLVHHHFPRKDDLVEAVVHLRVSEVGGLAAELPEGLPPAERLAGFARAVVTQVEADPARFRLYLRALTDDETRTIAGGFVQDRRAWTALFQALGAPDPELDARFFQVGLLGLLAHRVLSPHPVDTAPLVERLLAAVLPHPPDRSWSPCPPSP